MTVSEHIRELPGGSTLRLRLNRIEEMRDPAGTVAYACVWEGDRLRRADVMLPAGTPLTIETRAADHAIFGPCDRICGPDGDQLALCGSVNWARPRRLPPIDVPGGLPPGAGSAILNLLSLCAKQAGVDALHYRGPYPTGRLFDTLIECFEVTEPLTDAFARFTARLDETVLTGEVHEPAPVFVPHPFERKWLASRVCVQVRGALEKVYVDGVPYAFGGREDRRLVREGNAYVAYVYIAGQPWAEVVRLAESGRILDGPHALPRMDNPYLGKTLPATVRSVLLQAVRAHVPDLMHTAVDAVCDEVEIRWGDPGPGAASIEEGAIVLHAAFPERMAVLSFNAALAYLVPAVRPFILQLAQTRMSEAARESDD